MKNFAKVIFIISSQFCMSHSFASYEKNISIINYRDFIKDFYNKSLSIKIKEIEFESEFERDDAIKLYFTPKVKMGGGWAVAGPMNETEPNVSMDMNVYNSATTYRIDEHNNNLSYLKTMVEIEKRDATVIIMKNLIGLSLFTDLYHKLSDLEKNEQKMTEEIKVQNDEGLTEDSVLKQSQLLSKKISNEIKTVTQQIEEFKANIEAVTLTPFPETGVYIPLSLIDDVISFNYNHDWELKSNLDYKALSLQAAMLLSSANQQDSLVNANVVIENNFKHNRVEHVNMNGMSVGFNVSVNVFDLNQSSEKLSKMKTYEASRLKMDAKCSEIKNNLNVLDVKYSDSMDELKGLFEQKNLTEGILHDFDNEYKIGKVSFYEILNTKFDLISIEQKITTIKLGVVDNRLNIEKITNTLSFI